MMRYFQIAAVIAFISMGFAVKILVDQKRGLKEEILLLETQADITENNLKLVVQQLDREIEYRQIAETALNDLANEVPDVVYSQELPPQIQGVLDRFHERIRP